MEDKLRGRHFKNSICSSFVSLATKGLSFPNSDLYWSSRSWAIFFASFGWFLKAQAYTLVPFSGSISCWHDVILWRHATLTDLMIDLETGPLHAAQIVFKLRTHLPVPQPHTHRNYRYVPLYLALTCFVYFYILAW